METRPIVDKIIDFKTTTNHIIALDEKGRMWYRETPAYNSCSSFNNNDYYKGINPGKKKEELEEKYIWRLMPLITFVEHEPLPPPREIPADANKPLDVGKTETKKIDTLEIEAIPEDEERFYGMGF